MSNFTPIDPEDAMLESGSLPEIKPPPVLSEAAFEGLAGEFVEALSVHTEADCAAILGQVLVAFGAACGRGPHLWIDGSRHGTNEFLVIVGESSKARKGTSWNRTKETLSTADPDFFEHRVMGGLSSGEGLIYQVRDEVKAFDPKKGENYIADPGVSDKRLLLIEDEFSSILKQIERDGNTLSSIIRQSWDSRKLSPLTKNNRIAATNTHISIIGQITQDELKKRLTETETSNGFGNRFLWFYVKRSGLLPFGGQFERQREFGERFREALEFAQGVGAVGMSADFRTEWEAIYPILSEARPGLAGSLTSRSEAHAIRLSMIYALIDQSRTIRAEHLKSALAVIDFVDDSVDYVFGKTIGDPIADKILTALENGPITLTAISALFDGHASRAKIERALNMLAESGAIIVQIDSSTGGRPKTVIHRRGV